MKNEKGELFICPTPIGNMKDITDRIKETLKYVDLIACEDTRNGQKLLNQLGIKNNLVSYHKFNQEKKGLELIKKLESGENIALISDGGTPVISDPGSYLIAEAVNKDIKIKSLPGPSALITALAASGLEADRFYFLGFLPKKGADRQKYVLDILNSDCTIVFYESPNRIYKTLKEIAPKCQSRRIIIAREISKIYEEYIRGLGEEILNHLAEKNIKGELTVIIEGKGVNEKNVNEMNDEEIKEYLKKLIDQGFTKKDAVKSVVEVSGASKRKIYDVALKI
ncbi:16S rRNA (cytidine(1402)-2'-O)-methyltransferase [Natranaerofaba carboxydovora]|uniref:16S rRNA (cytidine(1402)-2'-O)-methyltransferase n=1 Tax=Natranaerofaba carboxydovora TaxID=2742683 RepID=UPI001F130027|nr:16S rRNA (cytidine(1402)-2'-O)-methyltransferase [Natranaerofaba carboxydovora]UMZ75245.1 Ribosomal RNA small subunit methyltransferase I [Natranaerofaba carboxydovora]